MRMVNPWPRSALLASLVLVVACGPSWRRIEPAGAGFALQMPANVDCGGTDWKHRTEDATWIGRTCAAEAEPLLSLMPASTGTYIHYSVMWAAVPSELNNASLEDVLAAFEAPEVKSRSPVIAEGQRFWETEGKEKYGHEFRNTTSSLGGQPAIHRDAYPTGSLSVEGFVGRSRVALHQGRLYELTVAGRGGARLEAIRSRMVESFTFIEHTQG